jgi:hypothetical protein
MVTIFNCLLVTIFVIAIDRLTYAACRFWDNPAGVRDSLALQEAYAPYLLNSFTRSTVRSPSPPVPAAIQSAFFNSLHFLFSFYEKLLFFVR